MRLKRIISMLLAAAVVLHFATTPTAYAKESLADFAQLQAALTNGGEYSIAQGIEFTNSGIKASVTINGTESAVLKCVERGSGAGIYQSTNVTSKFNSVTIIGNTKPEVGLWAGAGSMTFTDCNICGFEVSTVRKAALGIGSSGSGRQGAVSLNNTRLSENGLYDICLSDSAILNINRGTTLDKLRLQSSSATLNIGSDWSGEFEITMDSAESMTLGSVGENADISGITLVCPDPDYYIAEESGIMLIKKDDAPEGLRLNVESISPLGLKVGESKTVTPIFSYENVAISAVSTDSEVAQAEIEGKSIAITAHKAGFAQIVVSGEAALENNSIMTARTSFHVTVTKQSAESAGAPVNLIKDGKVLLPIIIDAEYEKDSSGHRKIHRAVGDLRQDFALVSGGMSVNDIPMDDTTKKKEHRLAAMPQDKLPRILTSAATEKTAIIIGSISSSAIIRSIISEGLLDEAAQIAGTWECYCIKTVQNPIAGIDSAIVIAGSDTRGTIYGIYKLSEYIGVSPWYWWSDVPVEVKTDITYDEVAIVNDGPSVKYRGIFINDEERLVDWAEMHFPDDGVHGPNEYIYRHMFEALLRLGANTLWPAMHEYTTAFNTPTDENGVPLSAKAADEYGIVMSSSHCEIMLRNNVGEWSDWRTANTGEFDDSSNLTYDYTVNKNAILKYWRERVEANKDFENIFVLGIRGIHDGKPLYARLESAGYGSGTGGIVNMMKDVISEQRQMIKDIFGSEDAVAQVFIPYKEMNDYYNYNDKELAKWLPDDVIIMYAEDNQGYLRQTATASERERSGGAGVYYHNSYWGTPKSYLWLNSMPISLMYEEMQKAYDTGMDKYWILNVGDLKPGELNAEFFMQMAWDREKFNSANIENVFYKAQAMRDYGIGEADADIYAASMMNVSQYIQRKRAEFYGYQNSGSSVSAYFPNYVFPFSVTQHGDEGQRQVDEWNEVIRKMDLIYAKLDEAHKTAFYEQVYHAALQNRNRAEEYVYYWKNQRYALQGRYASAKAYAELSAQASQNIDDEQNYFYTLNNGKWNMIIDYNHIIYYQRNQGALKVLPDMYSFADKANGVGAVCEGQKLPGDDVTLTFDSKADNSRFIDVFGKSDTNNAYVIKADSDWIELDRTSGIVYTENRIIITIDWDNAAEGENFSQIRVYNADESGVLEDTPVNIFKVKALKDSSAYEENTYSEANGYVVLEAEHFSDMQAAPDGSIWAEVANLGQVGSSMKGYPDLAKKIWSDYRENSAKLVYRVYFKNVGNFTGTLYRLPTLSEGSEDGIERSSQIAIGLDNGNPQLLHGTRRTSASAWGANVMRGYDPLFFTITVKSSGYHDIIVYKVDASVCFDRIVIATGSEAADESLIGPPESPHNIARVYPPAIGHLPDKITTAYAEGKPMYNVSFNKNKAVITVTADTEACLIFTQYDEDGSLINTRLHNQLFTAGETEIEIELDGKVCTMLWNGVKEMIPLTDKIFIYIGQ
ncbi:MAG: glycosyl hydrolase 115 family protein [Clostridia bacterium]|nr:glycosyl hydrolase 115 family protein [Clostridia bacterium]